MFEESARTIIDGVLEGYNGTIFAYGQTGAGALKRFCVAIFGPAAGLLDFSRPFFACLDEQCMTAVSIGVASLRCLIVSAGKTFTMEGRAGEHTEGVTPRTFSAIFEAIAATTDRQFLV